MAGFRHDRRDGWFAVGGCRGCDRYRSRNPYFHGGGRRPTVSVSLATVERLACETGYIPILFDQGQPLDVGRTQRLFTGTQRIALAARDGGCIAPGCDRPPLWCEAHHIYHWYRDQGKTDIADGVLLCHHHHLLFHNHGWEITRAGADYWIVPPTSIDPDRAPRPAQKRRQLTLPAIA